MTIVEFATRKPVTITMVAVAAVLFGLVSFSRLPITLLPEISYPSLTVETEYRGTAPVEVETLITKPIEEAVGVVSGVRHISSISKPGKSLVTLEFRWDTNMEFAVFDVRKKIDLLRLPEDADEPNILRYDPTLDPIMRVELFGQKDLIALRTLAEEGIKKAFDSVEGVAAVKIHGGFEEEIQVNLDEKKLAALNLDIQTVGNRLRQENVNAAGGSLYEYEARYLVRTFNEFQDIQEIEDTILAYRNGREIRLRDVAEVRRGFQEQEVIARVNGEEGVELALFKEGDANTTRTAKAIRARIETLREDLPKDVNLTIVFDQARFIESAINEVIKTALFGGLIAIVVLYFFLKDFRSTLIIGITIPLSIIATFFFMYQTGVSLNIMSLGGLALGVGMLVDSSIVVLEAIYRRREAGDRAEKAANRGASEVGMAIIASTLTTIAVFLPIVFVEGLAGQVFNDQALTVTFSLLTALIVALTLIPMLAAKSELRKMTAPQNLIAESSHSPSRLQRIRRFLLIGLPSILLFLGRRGANALSVLTRFIFRVPLFLFDRIFAVIARSYPHILSQALKARWGVLLASLLLFFLALGLGRSIGVELIPAVAQGEFTIDLHLPEGTPIQRTDRAVQLIEKDLRELSGIEMIFSTVGLKSGQGGIEGTSTENEAQINVVLSERGNRRGEAEAMAQVRNLLAQYAAIDYEIYRPTFFSFKTPVEIDVYGTDLNLLRQETQGLVADLRRIKGLTDFRSSAEEGNPELHVRFNRSRLAQLDLQSGVLSEAIRDKIKGNPVTSVTRGDREIEIVVRNQEDLRESTDDLRGLILASKNGRPITLQSVAAIQRVTGPAEIRRVNQKRAVVLSANLSGSDLGTVSAEIKPVLDRFNEGGVLTAALSGQNGEMIASFQSLYFAIALAVFLVYLVMASQFESFVHPLIILFSVPLGIVGVVLTLLITNTVISIIVLIGVIMLSGIVVNNAILLIDKINQFREKGYAKREAIIEAGNTRLRPILITTATTVLGLTPMALGFGEGAELRTPLAITVIGGLLLSTVLTLVVIPTVYWVFDRKEYAGDRPPQPGRVEELIPQASR